MINIRKLETELWEAADLLRADSKVTSLEIITDIEYNEDTASLGGARYLK